MAANCETRRGKNLRRHLIEVGLIFLAGYLMAFVFQPTGWDDSRFYYTAGPFSGLIWLSLWKGNELIFVWLDGYLPWEKGPLKRLFINLMLTISYTVLVMSAITTVIYLTEGYSLRQLSLARITGDSWIAVVITIIIATFLSARGFFLSWRALAVQNERLKRESLTSQFEVLKQQVNPHFLFNSLNTLTNLVYEDADQSARFIKQLSNVYRYVLDSHGKEVAPLKEELDFVRSYLFLQQIRYGDQLRIDIDLDAPENACIAPLALQMLVENAIKHNEISARHPLRIRIAQCDDAILVSNKMKRRNRISGENGGIGLRNIQSRYELLSDHSVLIEQDDQFFSVKLPLLYQEK